MYTYLIIYQAINYNNDVLLGNYYTTINKNLKTSKSIRELTDSLKLSENLKIIIIILNIQLINSKPKRKIYNNYKRKV